MHKKRCDACHKVSYSFGTDGIWLCPSCAHDMTSQPTLYVPPILEAVLPFSVSTEYSASCLN